MTNLNMGLVLHPEDYGAKGNGIDDDSAAIQACLNTAEARFPILGTNGARPVVELGSTNYVCNTGLGFDCGRVVLHGRPGAELNFTNCTTPAAIAISCWGQGNFGNKTAPAVKGISLHTGATQNKDGTIVGIAFTSPGDNSKYAIVENCTFRGFTRGVDWTGANNYLMKVRDCTFNGCVQGIVQLPGGNSGERMVIEGCDFGGCGTCINLNNSNADYYIRDCSFDYCDSFLLINGVTAYISNCHLETNIPWNPNSPWIQPGTAAFINVLNGQLLVDKSFFVWTAGSTNVPWIYYSGGSVRISDCEFSWGFGTQLGAQLAAPTSHGGGIFIERSRSDFTAPPFWSIDYNNSAVNNTLLGDPTFEKSVGGVLQDPWYIYLDTGQLNSRTAGNNLTISAGTTKPFAGTQALQAVKVGAAGTPAGFAVAVPVRTLNQYSCLFQEAVSAAGGSYVASFLWAQLAYYNSKGIPVYSQTAPAGAVDSITPGTSYTVGGVHTAGAGAPPWATHIILQFDLTGLGPETLYLDNVQPNQF